MSSCTVARSKMRRAGRSWPGDVTESNRLQAELSRAKELIDATFSSMGDAVALLDAEWKLLLVNDA
jgi:PAS domain-containing protein